MDLPRITIEEVQALLSLLADLEHEELELTMREGQEADSWGGCIGSQTRRSP
jgi:hypothetical protein